MEEKATDLAELVTYRVMLLADTLKLAATHAYGEKFRITVPELRILATVRHRQPVTANELSRITRIDKGWISRSIDDMIRRGLIMRTDSKTDRRQKNLHLTDEGESLTARIWPYALERSNMLIDGLDSDAVNRMIDVMQAHADEMLAESGRPHSQE